MNTAHQTRDGALVNLLRRVGQRGPGRAVLVILALVGSAVTLPNLAQAHDWGAPGLNGARLYLDRDGYPPQDSVTQITKINVQGDGFVPAQVAQIFQCRAGETEPIENCDLLGSAPTGAAADGEPGGAFSTDVLPRGSWVTAAGEQVACRGSAARDQCSIVAATFGLTGEPTAMAEHYICMREAGIFLNPNCIPGPQDPGGGSTTTTVPTTNASMALSNDNDLVVQGDVTLVTGAGFVADTVAEIFECLAGADDPRNECKLVGAAPTDARGEFGPVPVHVMTASPEYPSCAHSFEAQCSIVAGTFKSANGGLPTSRAENYICFVAPLGRELRKFPCTTEEPTGSVTTTTSTTVQPTTTTTTLPPPAARYNVADFDGNGSTDISVFRPSNGMWYIKDGQWTAWGEEGDIPVPGDYDGDGATDVAIFRASTGLWAIHYSGGGPDLFMTYGIATDVPVVADYDGDKKADIAVFRPEYATWWVHRSSDGADVPTTFGISTDIATPGFYDGDDKADIAVFRPESGTWYVQPSTGGSYTATNWGSTGDIPVPADYDADPAETTDFAVFRPSEGAWYVWGQGPLGLGASGDVPVPGHYDTDPSIDAAVFRPTTGEWLIHDGATVSWGGPGDVPLALPNAVFRRFF